MTHLLVLILAYDDVTNEGDDDYDGIDEAIDSLLIVLAAFLDLLHAVREVDSFLFDIPPEEEEAPLQFMHAKGLWIDDLSDIAAHKMTRFNWCQLKRLYAAFDLENQLKPMEEKLAFFTGHLKNDLYPCCYKVHQEEVFLFTLCHLATGMMQVHIVNTYFGGDKNHWTYTYPWMLK